MENKNGSGSILIYILEAIVALFIWNRFVRESNMNKAIAKAIIETVQKANIDLKPKQENEHELHLVGANSAKFAATIEALKELGCQYDFSELNTEEERAINEFLSWHGNNDTYHVEVWLMNDMNDDSNKNDYVKIYYSLIKKNR